MARLIACKKFRGMLAKKIYSLQSLRLFASLMVFQYHLWNNYLNHDFFHPGTDFFIVLVGFVSAVSQAQYIPSGNWGKYIWNRYLRLYVTFIPIFILYIIAGRDPFNLEYYIKSFFFIPIENKLPIVGPTWMLTLFLLFYWSFSLAFLFRRESVLIPVFTLWGLASLAYSWFNWNPGLPVEWSNALFNHHNIEFIFGYLGGKILLFNRIDRRAGEWVLAIGIVSIIPGIIILNLGTVNLIWRTFLAGIPTTIIILGFSVLEQHQSTNPLLRFLIHPWLIWLGGTSYVLYLIHNMVLRIWDTIIPITPIQIPLITIAVIGASAIGYRLWEKPVLEILKRKSYRRESLEEAVM